MKKSNIIILAVVAVIALWGFSSYNGLVSAEENVETSWAQVENQYQRRLDLIPNLVKMVKGYMKHEHDTFEDVIAARSKATQITIDPSNATPEEIEAFQAAQGEVSQALGRLLAITENYPDLKADKTFLDVMSQLEGTENRITVARNDFNTSAKDFNVKVRRFPGSIIASICGFEKKGYFKAEAGAEKAPEIDLE